MKDISTRRSVLRRYIIITVLSVMATMPVACGTPRRQAPAGPPSPVAEANNPASAGASQQPRAPADEAECELWVTRDFGSFVIKRVTAPFSDGESVMEVLKRHCRVETAYGGGFVRSLDGLASTRGRAAGGGDWFYYVDGVLAGRGALETSAPAGGVVWWDYHAWSYGGGQFLAVVGAWPRPFTGKSTILHTAGGAKAAQTIASALKDAGGPSPGRATDLATTVSEYDGGPLAERSTPTMLVGVAGKLLESEWVAGLFRNAWRAGMPGTIRAPGHDGGLVGLDAAGKEVARWAEGSGLIVATASYMGDGNPLWIVAGWDEQGLNRAAEALAGGLRSDSPLRYAFAVAVTPTNVERLPLGAGRGRN
ncbi:MAG: DUF4430 domain-containing protein [Firmicutes bacterium]|nr:DUF4430 domain-containing protein [Bacillota bacterium]